MTCFHQRLIANPSLSFNEACNRSSYKVPCNVCDACRESRKQDYITRLNFAMKENSDNGGTNIFLTFTYNDEHLPYLNYHGESCQCFSKDDVQRLVSSIRKYYDKRGLKFQYFIGSEYGEDTQRPHYHGTFILPKEIDPYQFTEKARKSWTHMYIKELGSYTNNGFMFPNVNEVKLGEMFVRNADHANQYLSKYTVKDLAFYRIPLIKSVSEHFLTKGNRLSTDPKIKAIYRYYNDRMPRVYHSINLGSSSILDYLIDNPSATKITNPYTGYLVSIPRSIIDKFSYEFIKSDRISPVTGKPIVERYLTDNGLKRRLYLLPELIEDKVRSYKTLLTSKSQSDLLFAATYHYVYRYYSQQQLASYYYRVGDLFSDINYLSFFTMNLINERMTLDWLPTEMQSIILKCYNAPLLNTKEFPQDFQIIAIKLNEKLLEKKLLERSEKETVLRLNRQKTNDAIKLIVNPNLDQQIGTDANIYKPIHFHTLVS